MTQNFFFLVYVSSAVVPFSETEQLELLEKSRVNNSQLGITGLLLSKGGNFMQLLEGPERSVRDLLSKIERDPRHKGFIVLLDGYTETRQFPQWKMGFKSLPLQNEISHEAYSDFLNLPLDSKEFVADPSKCQRLMIAFKKSQR
jgi:hypothetical protein